MASQRHAESLFWCRSIIILDAGGKPSCLRQSVTKLSTSLRASCFPRYLKKNNNNNNLTCSSVFSIIIFWLCQEKCYGKYEGFGAPCTMKMDSIRWDSSVFNVPPKKNLSFICFQGFIDKMLCGFSFLRPSWKKNLKSKTTTGQFFHVLVTNKKKKWTHIFVTV